MALSPEANNAKYESPIIYDARVMVNFNIF